MENFSILYENLLKFQWQDIVMILLGCLLIYMAIKKEMEPSLLLPMGLGTILVNIPGSTALVGPIQELYNAGIANELFPLLLFIGIGAMIDFGPLLSNPKLMLFGAAAQFGIFFTLSMASIFFILPPPWFSILYTALFQKSNPFQRKKERRTAPFMY